MLSLLPRPPRPAAAILVAALCLGIGAGCGGNGSSKTAKERTSPKAAAAATLGEHPDPYKLTCSDLVNRENYPPVYNAAVALARAANVANASDQQAATRIYAAVHGVCAKHKNAGYRPARDAVAAVKRGEYKTESRLP